MQLGSNSATWKRPNHARTKVIGLNRSVAKRVTILLRRGLLNRVRPLDMAGFQWNPTRATSRLGDPNSMIFCPNIC